MFDKRFHLEMPGIEPGAFHMQSERSTTEPHPRLSTFVSMTTSTTYMCNMPHTHTTSLPTPQFKTDSSSFANHLTTSRVHGVKMLPVDGANTQVKRFRGDAGV